MNTNNFTKDIMGIAQVDDLKAEQNRLSKEIESLGKNRHKWRTTVETISKEIETLSQQIREELATGSNADALIKQRSVLSSRADEYCRMTDEIVAETLPVTKKKLEDVQLQIAEKIRDAVAEYRDVFTQRVDKEMRKLDALIDGWHGEINGLAEESGVENLPGYGRLFLSDDGTRSVLLKMR